MQVKALRRSRVAAPSAAPLRNGPVLRGSLAWGLSAWALPGEPTPRAKLAKVARPWQEGPTGYPPPRLRTPGARPPQPVPRSAPVTTPLFVKGDPCQASNRVFGVKPSQVGDFEKRTAEGAARALGVQAPFCVAQSDFGLQPAQGRIACTAGRRPPAVAPPPPGALS